MSKHAPDSYRGILAISIPIIAGMAGGTIMMFCDRLFLAQHSQLELQAALPAGVLSFTLLCILLGTVSYSSTFVSQYFGAGDREGCSKSLAQGLYLTMISVPVLAAITIPGSMLLNLSGHAHEVLALEHIYFRILMLSASGLVFTAAASSFWNGRGKTVPVMLAVLFGAGVNIFLDYVMIFGKLGFPEMGIRGAAIATAISSFIPGTILTIAAYTGKTALSYKTRENFKFSWPLTKRILRFGFPAGLQMFVDFASFTIFIFIAGRLEVVDFAANNIAFSVNNLVFNPLLGFGFATTVIVGRIIGMGNPDMAIRATRRALLLALCYFVPLAATFVLFPGFYTKLFFSPDSSCTIEELSSTAGKLLAIVAVWGIFDAVNLTYSGALRGAGDTKFVVWVSGLLGWLFWIPGVIYLYAVRQSGIVELWLFTSLYVALFSLVFFLRFRTGKWKKIDLLGTRIESTVAD
ncbi:MAG: MATE family efflux transporter [Candidatus Fermentibacteria bacterium]|nr:MATE family efflux transporter [Candidatus Fermentibacteria bacterium]